MSRRYTVQDGIILRRSELPNGDVVVTLLGETGKWRGIARKGKLVGGNVGKLSLFHDVTVQHYTRPNQEDMALITQVQLNGALPGLSDPSVYPYAHVLAELTDKLTVDMQPDAQLYHYFAAALRGVAGQPDPEHIALVMSWRLLARAGLAPRLSRCARCGAKDISSAQTFDVSAGGLSCSACKTGFRITEAVRDELALIHGLSVAEVLGEPLTERPAHWALLSRYVGFHVGEVKSFAHLPKQRVAAA